LLDTGEQTMTGGRLKRAAPHIDNETFCFTYGDGVSDIDISKLIAYHKSSGRQATVTAIQPPGRYGALKIENGNVLNFQEKPAGDSAWINGGFFVLEPSVLENIDGDNTVWEQEPLQQLALKGQLSFWQAMDTLREKKQLEELWSSGKAPWKSW
jgi:glucose-1-phosphate cytidylyltransferase